MCKYFEPINDINAQEVRLNGCKAKVARRHWWLRKLFGNKYINIFSKDWLYPNDEHSDCSYYKQKITKHNIGTF